MIIDLLNNHPLYHSLHPRLARALKHVASTDFSQLKTGTYPLEGKDIFVIVNDYDTKNASEDVFEAHQQYIDIQYVVSGVEAVGYLPLHNQTPLAPYNAEHDCIEFDYHTLKHQASFVTLSQGMFALLFPDDIHMPGVSSIVDTPQPVRKVVVKVKI